MPTQSYGSSNLGSFQNLDDPPLHGSSGGVGFNINSLVSGDASGGETSAAAINVLRSATISYSSFPSIPATATITRVRITAQINGILTLTPVTGNVSGGVQARIGVGADPGSATFQDIAEDSASGATPGVIVLTLSPTTELEINVTGLIFTRADLQAAFGEFFITQQLSGSNAVPDSCNASGSVAMSSWTLEVTYDLEHYSWYIKPTTQIVNGLPTRVIASPDDIIAVPDGDPIPDEYEFYGTGDDYPDGPTYYWWTSEDYYTFYIFSPISPDLTCEDLVFPPTRCKGTWVPIGVSPPTCVNCTSVSLGELEILVADASGVYRFDSSAKHDTLYVREGFSIFVDTVDVKIPNPFAKTGFVP